MLTFVHLFLVVTGCTNASGAWYLWWSGFFADLIIFAAAGHWFRGRSCHEPWCIRTGKHPAAGGLVKYCARHHPDALDGKFPRHHVHLLHRQWKAAQS